MNHHTEEGVGHLLVANGKEQRVRIFDPCEDLGPPVVLAVVLEPQEGDVQVGWSGGQKNLFLCISLAPGFRGQWSDIQFVCIETCTCRTGIGSLHQVFLALSSLSRARAR